MKITTTQIVVGIVIIAAIIILAMNWKEWFGGKKTEGKACTMADGSLGTYDKNGICIGEGPGPSGGGMERK